MRLKPYRPPCGALVLALCSCYILIYSYFLVCMIVFPLNLIRFKYNHTVEVNIIRYNCHVIEEDHVTR